METFCDDLDLDNRLKIFTQFLDQAKLQVNTYQIQGVRWCLRNELYPYVKNIRGGFLADEMGLGKTIMMIGVFLSNFKSRTLVVVPPALINQWQNQILKTTGHNPIIFHGPNKKNITISDLQNSCIVITTYGAIVECKRKNSPIVPNKLYDILWGRIVFDEAHHLRNKNTRNFCVNMLKTELRWLVSGTPIQNSFSDLRNLFRVLGDFPSQLLTKKNIPFIIKNYMLRRTKLGVGIDIPQMNVVSNVIDWKNSKEKELSKDIHSSLHFSNISPTRGSFMFFDKSPIVRCILARQISIYPPLIKNPPLHYLKEIQTYSTKLDYVSDFIISKKGNGNGKIVFCHFRGEIDEIHSRLKSGGYERVACIDGRTSTKMKNMILADDNDVIILQIQTCCEGLNLQDNYSEIYFISPNWNPAIEDQAIARCHRIGQKKNVSVYRFVMSCCFDSTPVNVNINSIVVYNNDKQNDNDELPPLSIEGYISNMQDVKRTIANTYIDCAAVV